LCSRREHVSGPAWPADAGQVADCADGDAARLLSFGIRHELLLPREQRSGHVRAAKPLAALKFPHLVESSRRPGLPARPPSHDRMLQDILHRALSFSRDAHQHPFSSTSTLPPLQHSHHFTFQRDVCTCGTNRYDLRGTAGWCQVAPAASGRGSVSSEVTQVVQGHNGSS
jgi:hypothetical protein